MRPSSRITVCVTVNKSLQQMKTRVKLQLHFILGHASCVTCRSYRSPPIWRITPPEVDSHSCIIFPNVNYMIQAPACHVECVICRRLGSTLSNVKRILKPVRSPRSERGPTRRRPGIEPGLIIQNKNWSSQAAPRSLKRHSR